MKDFTVEFILYFERNPQWTNMCIMDVTRVDIDIMQDNAITTVWTKYVKINKSNYRQKSSFTVVLSGSNNGIKLILCLFLMVVIRSYYNNWIERIYHIIKSIIECIVQYSIWI